MHRPHIYFHGSFDVGFRVLSGRVSRSSRVAEKIYLNGLELTAIDLGRGTLLKRDGLDLSWVLALDTPPGARGLFSLLRNEGTTSNRDCTSDQGRHTGAQRQTDIANS